MTRYFALAVLALLSVGSAVATPKETLLRRFNGQVGKGLFPASGLISDANGNLYGTTFEGGSSNFGTIYKMTPPGKLNRNWEETVIYSFTGGNDGQNPYVALTIDAAGNLYGASQRGQFSNSSTIFQLSPGEASWTFHTVCSFDPAQFGAVYIGSSLTLDQDGNLYGEAAQGGRTTLGFVYRLTPPVQSGGSWGADILYTFQGALSGEDGAWPSGGLALDSLGNIYGTTQLNGYPRKCNRAGCGTVFELTPPTHEGGAWKENVIYRFQNHKDGAQPAGGVVLDAKGNLYGTASSGGDRLKDGVVFEVKPNGDGTWSESVIHAFSSNKEGSMYRPYAGLTMDTSGNLFGTTFFGGDPDSCVPPVCGGVFELSPPRQSKDRWTETTLHLFGGAPDGATPQGRLYLSHGALYGVTEEGGDEKTQRCQKAGGCGTVFKITP